MPLNASHLAFKKPPPLPFAVKKGSGGEIVDQVRHNRSLDEASRHVLDVNPLQVAVVVIDRVGSVLADAAFSHVIRDRIV